VTKLRVFALSGLSLAVLISSSPSARALVVAPAPVPQRVIVSDTIITGTVTSVEEKTINSTRYPTSPQVEEYKVAVVKIDKAFKGANGLTHVRVGFVPPTPVEPIQPLPGQPVRPLLPRRPGAFQPTLEKGQEVCLFLNRHHKEQFLVADNYYDVVDVKKNPNFTKAELPLIEKTLKSLDNPIASLQSKDPEERYMTAAVLLTKYRNSPRFTTKPQQEPIDARESKLILQALVDADWEAKNRDPLMMMMNPMSMFYRLGLTPKDGYTQPMGRVTAKDIQDHAKKWLRANVDTYRIQKYVDGAEK
jgi:hypothetical protein